MPFTTRAQVRFADVDPAGIVFYPRYFEMLNGAVEDWFEQDLGLDFAAMHLERRIGVPTVKLETEFLSPSRLGDRLDITVTAQRLGRTSCGIEVVFAGEGRTRSPDATARTSFRSPRHHGECRSSRGHSH